MISRKYVRLLLAGGLVAAIAALYALQQLTPSVASHDEDVAAANTPFDFRSQADDAVAVSVPPSADIPSPEQLSAGVRIPLMSFNVLRDNLTERMSTVVAQVAQQGPSIASIQELVDKRDLFLRQLRDVSGQDYTFASGDIHKRVWDADILYRADEWRELRAGTDWYEFRRALSWVVLEHKATQERVLVVGLHTSWHGTPVVQAERIQRLVRHIHGLRGAEELPVLLLGDFNSMPGSAPQRLLQEGQLEVGHRNMQVPLRFRNTYQDGLGPFVSEPVTAGRGQIDYIFVSADPRWYTTVASVLESSAGSDHKPVSAEVALIPRS